MRRIPNQYPSKKFWTQYQHLVLVDTNRMVSLTRMGKETLGVAMAAAGNPVTGPLPMSEFLRLAEEAAPYAWERRADMALLRKLPRGSAELELLAQLLGAPVPCAAGTPQRSALVLDFIRLRAARAA